MRRLPARAREALPEASILGVTVQTQVQETALELILGCKKDPNSAPCCFSAWAEY